MAANFIELFRAADKLRARPVSTLRGRIMATVFYEPSTRTSCSFAAAMIRLGGQVIQVDVNNSSVRKGESLADTIRTLSQMVDVIVLRYPTVGACAEAARHSNVPLINAGDGSGEHPTQALLDLYTIWREFGAIDGRTITFMGDLLHSRTVHSLMKVLKHFDVTIHQIAPPGLERDANERTPTALERDVILGSTDVLYVVRPQRERHARGLIYEPYRVDASTLAKMKKTAIVMHPLPRTDELAAEVDDDPRAAYFRQVENGVWVRAALLVRLLKKQTVRALL